MAFTFAPIIGSGFDAVAAQQQHWAGFNSAIEQANIERLNRAQENANRWRMGLSDLYQRASDQTAAMQMRSDETSRAAAQEQANADRQFSFALQSEKDRMKEERARTDAMNEQARMRLDFQRQEQENKINSAGEAYASNYLKAQAAADASQKELTDLLGEIQKVKDKQEQLQAKPFKDLTDQEKQQFSTLPMTMRELEKQRQAATTRQQRAEADFQAYKARIFNSGFNITDDEVVHENSGKRWKISVPELERKPRGGDDSTSFGGFDKTGEDSGLIVTPPKVPSGFTGTGPVFSFNQEVPEPVPVIAPQPSPADAPKFHPITFGTFPQVPDPTQQPAGQLLTKEIARQFYAMANGDRRKAEQLARQAGYTF